MAIARHKKALTNADILTAAQLFYIDKKQRKQIASTMGIDPRRVSLLLEEALKRNIVAIQIYESSAVNIERRLQEKYRHLQRVIIAAGAEVTTPARHTVLHQKWASMAARYFDGLYAQHPQGKPIHVGVGGGEHILEFVNAVAERDREHLHIHVTALIGRGRLSESTIHNDPIVNAGILWSHSGRFPGRSEYATVSAYVTRRPGPAAREAVKVEIKKVESNRAILEVIEAMNSIDIAFVGIGSVNVAPHNQVTKNRIAMTGLLENIITQDQLIQEGAIGDISYCLFDEKGNSRKKWEFFLTAGHGSPYAGVEFYKHMVEDGKKVVAFGGPFQADAIRVALKAKMFNVWFTDEHTARQIADES